MTDFSNVPYTRFIFAVTTTTDGRILGYSGGPGGTADVEVIDLGRMPSPTPSRCPKTLPDTDDGALWARAGADALARWSKENRP